MESCAAKSLILTLVLAVFGPCKGSDVTVVTDADFQSSLTPMDTALVMFYAPWCGHCKKLMPEFEQAATALKAHDPAIRFAKIDCTGDGQETCKQHQVSRYPTVKIFHKGADPKEYKGPRQSDKMVDYLKRYVTPVLLAKDESELQQLLAKDKAVLVSYYADQSDRNIFEKVAKEQDKSDVYFVQAPDTSKGNRLLLHRPAHLQSKFEDGQVQYNGSADKESIIQWIEANLHGLVGHRTLDNINQFQDSSFVMVYYNIDYAKDVKGTNYVRNRILRVAKQFTPRFRFAMSDSKTFKPELQGLGLKADLNKPQVAMKTDKGIFVMSAEFSVDSFEQFLHDYESGKLKPYVKSEPEPESNDGPVKVAVTTNFDSLVRNSDKDVLIEFYAPWCGHCNSLIPIYEQLGQKMAGEEVLIVKMDATANEVPKDFHVPAFPTIYWLPKDTKVPVEYKAERTLQHFISFVAEKATLELNKFDRKGKEKKLEL